MEQWSSYGWLFCAAIWRSGTCHSVELTQVSADALAGRSFVDPLAGAAGLAMARLALRRSEARRADPRLAPLPGRAQIGQQDAIEPPPAGDAPPVDDHCLQEDQRRVAGGRAGEHEREVHQQGEERRDGCEPADEQTQANEELAEDNDLAEPHLKA